MTCGFPQDSENPEDSAAAPRMKASGCRYVLFTVGSLTEFKDVFKTLILTKTAFIWFKNTVKQ